MPRAAEPKVTCERATAVDASESRLRVWGLYRLEELIVPDATCRRYTSMSASEMRMTEQLLRAGSSPVSTRSLTRLGGTSSNSAAWPSVTSSVGPIRPRHSITWVIDATRLVIKEKVQVACLGPPVRTRSRRRTCLATRKETGQLASRV